MPRTCHILADHSQRCRSKNYRYIPTSSHMTGTAVTGWFKIVDLSTILLEFRNGTWFYSLNFEILRMHLRNGKFETIVIIFVESPPYQIFSQAQVRHYDCGLLTPLVDASKLVGSSGNMRSVVFE